MPMPALLPSLPRLRRMAFAAGLALLATLIGCGGGGGGSSAGATLPAPAPFNLAVSANSTFDSLGLDWGLPATHVLDGYTLEASLSGGPFQTVTTDLIPKTWLGLILTFTPTTPEALAFQFRLGAVRNGVVVEYTNVVSYTRGLRAVSSLSVNAPSKYGVQVTWFNESAVADQILVERAPAGSAGTPGAWTVVATLPATATYFLDQNLLEGPGYAYRVSCHLGTFTSLAVPGTSGPVALAPITNLAVSPQLGGLQLTWANHSALATELAVWRVPGPGLYYPNSPNEATLVATLGPSTSIYLDMVPSPGQYAYFVEARTATASAYSPLASARYQPPGAPLFATQSLLLPTSLLAFISPQGVIALGPDPISAACLRLYDGSAWKTYPTTGTGWADPLLRYDHLGRPHTVSELYHPDGTVTLIHEWFDGSIWQQDPVPSSPVFYAPQALFELDDQDGVHVVLDASSGPQPTTSGLRYLHQVAGVWTEESLDLLVPTPFYMRFSLAVTPLGSPRVVVWGTDQKGYELTRSDVGSWSGQVLPGPAQSYGQFSKFVYLDEQTALLLFDRSIPATPFADLDLLCQEKHAGAWQTPYQLGFVTPYGTLGAISRSPDHARVAVTALTAAGGCLHLYANGAWRTFAIDGTFLWSFGLPFLGFDTSNHLLLFGRDAVTQDPVTTYRLLREQP